MSEPQGPEISGTFTPAWIIGETRIYATVDTPTGEHRVTATRIAEAFYVVRVFTQGRINKFFDFAADYPEVADAVARAYGLMFYFDGGYIGLRQMLSGAP